MIHLEESWKREAARLGPTSLSDAAMTWDAPDPARDWIPDTLLPLSGCDGCARLTPVQKRFYNHAYAAQLLEEFIWIESRLIVAPLTVLRRGWTGDAGLVLDSFLADERAHIVCFKRLRVMTGFAQTFFTPPGDLEALARLVGWWPQRFSFWPEVVFAFEQYAIDIAKRCVGDSGVDPLFREVFIAHARDEARHIRFDALLRDVLAPGALSTRLGAFFQRAYYATDWGLEGPISALVQAFPDLGALGSDLRTQARVARHVKTAAA